ncbi:MAG: TadE/TadG family type IV pilus assembly protein [Anaerolineae bacterium]
MFKQLLRHQRKEYGQSLVEVALFLPIFIVILAGLVEVSNLVITQNRVSNAARVGARYAANGGEDTGMDIAVLNSITQTLDTDESRWDVWAIRGAFDASGASLTDWSFTHVYGISNTVDSANVA